MRVNIIGLFTITGTLLFCFSGKCQQKTLQFSCSFGLPDSTINLGEKKKFPIDYSRMADIGFNFWLEIPVDVMNENRIHTMVSNFSHYNRIDSVRLMIDYIIELYKYNKKTYPQLASRLKALEAAEIAYCKQTLCGAWKSEPVRINIWDINTGYYNPNEKMLANNTTLRIYKNDTLYRQTDYTIYGVKNDSNNFEKQHMVLELLDTHEKWKLHFIAPGGSIPWHSSTRELFLYFVYPDNCVGNCSEKSFTRMRLVH